MNGSRFVTGAAGGAVSSMSVFVGNVGAAPNNQFQLAIYSDVGGSPGVLLAQSATGSLVGNAWNTLPVSATLSANTAYWLVYNTNGSNPNLNNMKYASGGQGGWSNGAVTFGSWPASFGSAAAASITFSIFATYDTGPVPDPSVALTAPAANSTVSGSTAISASASNAVGVQFQVDGVNVGAEDTSAPFSVSWDTTSGWRTGRGR